MEEVRHSPKNVGDSVVRRTRSGERQLTGGLVPQLALYLIKRNPPKRSIVACLILGPGVTRGMQCIKYSVYSVPRSVVVDKNIAG